MDTSQNHSHSEDLSEDTSQNQSQTHSEYLSEDTSQNQSQTHSEFLSEDTSQNQSQRYSEDLSEDTSQNQSQTYTEDIRQVQEEKEQCVFNGYDNVSSDLHIDCQIEGEEQCDIAEEYSWIEECDAVKDYNARDEEYNTECNAVVMKDCMIEECGAVPKECNTIEECDAVMVKDCNTVEECDFNVVEKWRSPTVDRTEADVEESSSTVEDSDEGGESDTVAECDVVGR